MSDEWFPIPALPRHSSLVTRRFFRPPRREDTIVAGVPPRQEPAPAAETVEPPLLLGQVEVAPRVKMLRPALGGHFAGGSFVILAAEAEFSHRASPAVRAFQGEGHERSGSRIPTSGMPVIRAASIVRARMSSGS